MLWWNGQLLCSVSKGTKRITCEQIGSLNSSYETDSSSVTGQICWPWKVFNGATCKRKMTPNILQPELLGLQTSRRKHMCWHLVHPRPFFLRFFLGGRSWRINKERVRFLRLQMVETQGSSCSLWYIHGPCHLWRCGVVMFSHCFFRQTRPFGREEQMYSINEKFCKIGNCQFESWRWKSKTIYRYYIYICMTMYLHVYIYIVHICASSLIRWIHWWGNDLTRGHMLSDTWVMDVKAQEWRVAATAGIRPPARQAAGRFSHQGKLLENFQGKSSFLKHWWNFT